MERKSRHDTPSSSSSSSSCSSCSASSSSSDSSLDLYHKKSSAFHSHRRRKRERERERSRISKKRKKKDTAEEFTKIASRSKKKKEKKKKKKERRGKATRSNRSCSCDSRSPSPVRRSGQRDRKRPRRSPTPSSSQTTSDSEGHRQHRPSRKHVYQSIQSPNDEVEIFDDHNLSTAAAAANKDFDCPREDDCPNELENVDVRREEGYGCDSSIPRLKSMVVASTFPVGSTDEDDLEAMLRHKALQNLKKFRRNSSSHAKSSRDHRTGTTEDGNLLQKHKPSADVSVEYPMLLDQKGVFREGTGNGDQIAKSLAADVLKPTFLPDHRNTHRFKDQQKMVEQVDNGRSLLTRKHELVGEKNSCQVMAGPSSILEHEPEQKKNEGNGSTNVDPELESRIMTVMHGGESVQVKYKVYIPKKAPLLTRRPLKR